MTSGPVHVDDALKNMTTLATGQIKQWEADVSCMENAVADEISNGVRDAVYHLLGSCDTALSSMRHGDDSLEETEHFNGGENLSFFRKQFALPDNVAVTELLQAGENFCLLVIQQTAAWASVAASKTLETHRLSTKLSFEQQKQTINSLQEKISFLDFEKNHSLDTRTDSNLKADLIRKTSELEKLRIEFKELKETRNGSFDSNNIMLQLKESRRRTSLLEDENKNLKRDLDSVSSNLSMHDSIKLLDEKSEITNKELPVSGNFPAVTTANILDDNARIKPTSVGLPRTSSNQKVTEPSSSTCLIS